MCEWFVVALVRLRQLVIMWLVSMVRWKSRRKVLFRCSGSMVSSISMSRKWVL